MNYFNEIHAVWEPLIERVDSGRRRWNLELEVNVTGFKTFFSSHEARILWSAFTFRFAKVKSEL